MEAWITCEKNRKFSKALETLLLFFLVFFLVLGQQRHLSFSLIFTLDKMPSAPLSARYKTFLGSSHSLAPTIYSLLQVPDRQLWPEG